MMKANIMASRPEYRRPSRKLTESDAAVIINRIGSGEFQNRIAADYDVNPGRIAEIKKGKTFPDLPRPWKWK